MDDIPGRGAEKGVPDWVSVEVKRYLAHTENGRSIRSLAREAGCHASTILRQVRRFESRREDVLVDLALNRLGNAVVPKYSDGPLPQDGETMNTELNVKSDTITDDKTLRQEAPRILRRLNEPGACLAIAKDMEKAVVVRDSEDGQTLRTAVVERQLAEAMALKDWITASNEGRISRYRITSSGRSALKRFLAEDEAKRLGFQEHNQPFLAQHGDHQDKSIAEGPNKRRRVRYNAVESPLQTLARRRDKDGAPFLGADLVAAGERLREDFELAQMGPRITQNWDRFLSGGARGDFSVSGGMGNAAESARDRVTKALADLGPGLGDVVLRCCCFLEGMEAAERRMGWSARSGKIVLRIALTRLKRHYDEAHGNWSPLIG
ncbi:MAG: DUF6456 domain-containing protein [Boseongicola sp.]|nr:DUF6456 domain-containing protein [Boseongicola sp.]